MHLAYLEAREEMVLPSWPPYFGDGAMAFGLERIPVIEEVCEPKNHIRFQQDTLLVRAFEFYLVEDSTPDLSGMTSM